MATDEIPDGWAVYQRESDGQWAGAHYGPHGVTTQLADATEDGLVAKINARAEYRAASGFEDRPATALRTTP